MTVKPHLETAPATEAECAAFIAEAAREKNPIEIAGSATRRGFGRPLQTALNLSTRALTGVTLYEPAELVIGAKAGTPLKLVQETLAEKGQELSFEPMDHRALFASEGEPTIGAVAAGNMSGPRRIMAGACRDSLIGVRLVNGRGEIVKSGGRVMKNVTGLDLVKLAAGSWGTLGLMTEVIFKIQPKPETTATLVLHGLDDRRAVEAMAAALGSPFEITGAAHLSPSIERVAKTLLRIEGFEVSVAYRLGELKTSLAPFGTADIIEGETAAMIWRKVRDAEFLAEPREAAVWRLSTAPSEAPRVVEAIARALPVRHFLDWGGGLIWLACDPAGDAGAAAIRAALESQASSGHATLVRAPAEIRAAVDVFQPLSPPLEKLTRGIKESFDPDGILNPGRMYAGI